MRIGRIIDAMADEVPDIYSDNVNIVASAYDLTLRFMKSDPGSTLGKIPDFQQAANVRMSLQQAKILAILLRKNLAEYERQAGMINVHPEVCKALGVSLTEDWS
jgi:hypothetical protein